MKLLTIVIPTYNMEALLPRCLDSLVTPVATDKVEVLVVNDGSKDNSLAVAQKYEAKYPNIIKVVDKKNGNYGSTINKGIELAKGKYFRILDSDDFYNNDELVSFVEKLGSCNTDLVLTDYCVDRENHTSKMKISGIENDVVHKLEEVDISQISNFAMHSLTIKTSILKDNKITLQTGISYTDTEFCYYPLLYSKTICYYNFFVYRYQIGRDGQTVNLDSQIRCLSHMRKIIYRMFDNLDVAVPESVNRNRCFIASKIINLYYSTILCYDKSNKELSYLSDVDKKLDNYKYIDAYLRKNTMFGVSFYSRYHDSKLLSNGSIYYFYYRVVKYVSRLYRIMFP